MFTEKYVAISTSLHADIRALPWKTERNADLQLELIKQKSAALQTYYDGYSLNDFIKNS